MPYRPVRHAQLIRDDGPGVKMPVPDLPMIRRALTVLAEPGLVTELRVLGGGQVLQGFYQDPDALARDAAQVNGRPGNCFITLNRLVAGVPAVVPDGLLDRPGAGARDEDIARVRCSSLTSTRCALRTPPPRRTSMARR
jgi:hypothetical protein